MNPFDILSKIHFEVVETPYERVGLFRLGSVNGEPSELVFLERGMHKPHKHLKVDSAILIVYGSGKVLLNGRWEPYGPDQSFFYKKGQLHGFDVEKDTLLHTRTTGEILDPVTGEFDFFYDDQK